MKVEMHIANKRKKARLKTTKYIHFLLTSIEVNIKVTNKKCAFGIFKTLKVEVVVVVGYITYKRHLQLQWVTSQ